MKPSIKSYLKRYLNEVIYGQAFSEGISATFPETQRILAGQKVDKLEQSDVNVIISLKKGWNYIYDRLGDELYLEDIQLLNALVSDDTNDQPGQLRNTDVYVMDKDYNRWYPELPNKQEITESLFKLKQIENPLEQALETLLYISKTQIFNNCNKRTAFLLANKILIENELGLLYPIANKELDNKYKELLVESYKDEVNKDSLFISLLENNFHNYDLDSVRKETNNEHINFTKIQQLYNTDFIDNENEEELEY